jgi:hypothetical protein
MRIDLYTKALLTLIVLLLATIACKSLFQPGGASAASADFTVLCTACYFPGLPEQSHVVLIDRNSGDIWAYNAKAMSGTEKPFKLGRFVLGQPVIKN